MFEKLLSEGGLSLDRLKALLEVGAAGGIAKATGGDPVKQSQYSRQIKELEEFFRVKLAERHGKGIRLTEPGRELARISRFFLLGLSNFQRGCLAEEQSFRIGASATFIRQFLLPVVSDLTAIGKATRYAVETVSDAAIEQRLHDLTLDFGVTTAETISRPLQLKDLGAWRLKLWAPRSLYSNEKAAATAFKLHQLPLAVAETELPAEIRTLLADHPPRLVCGTFVEVITAMEKHALAAVLPDFLSTAVNSRRYLAVRIPALESARFHFHLAWNPRLLRLNPPAVRRRDFLFTTLAGLKGCN